MGNIVSAINSDITTVVKTVTEGITDVGAAVTSLKGITSSFLLPASPPQSQAGFHTSNYIVSSNSSDDVDSALKETIQMVKKGVNDTFKNTFKGSTAAGTDYGIVQAYVLGGGVACVAKQIEMVFDNWGINADSQTAQTMAETIAEEITAKAGGPGVAHGHHTIDGAQRINWAVGYGIFATGRDKKGLVYAFTASFDTTSIPIDDATMK